jgi:hypothetical protein
MAGQTACPEETLARARKRCVREKGAAGQGGEISDLKFEI